MIKFLAKDAIIKEVTIKNGRDCIILRSNNKTILRCCNNKKLLLDCKNNIGNPLSKVLPELSDEVLIQDIK